MMKLMLLRKNNIGEVMELPKWQKTIGVKWVYKTKLKKNDEIDKYKAHLVAKGYKQWYGIDYKEVFTLITSHDIIRLIIDLVA